MTPHEGRSHCSIVATITSASSPSQLNQYLRSCTSKDVKEVLLASILPGSQDPLALLNARDHTLGMLYILSVRLHTVASDKPLWHHIEGFYRDFIPEHARLAPNQVTLLATGIRQFAEVEGNPKLAIAPLSDLFVKYPPTLSHLTTIHPIFLMVCVTTCHFTAAIPVLAHSITTNWSAAEELFEICASSPGSAASAIQMEALKKLALIQLIYRGKTSPPSKYMHPILMRLFKATPYSIENEQQLFANERTLGLITQALDCIPRWAIKKLTTIYLTLHLSDIGREVGISDENEVKSLILTSHFSCGLPALFNDLTPRSTRMRSWMLLLPVQRRLKSVSFPGSKLRN
ncbi:hypothetical protein F4604DRAFT_1885307 [Suillus subluteus]|nr:hypothetical protein F4604DRAFT_1885307 [Suillus subluteus]